MCTAEFKKKTSDQRITRENNDEEQSDTQVSARAAKCGDCLVFAGMLIVIASVY